MSDVRECVCARVRVRLCVRVRVRLCVCSHKPKRFSAECHEHLASHRLDRRVHRNRQLRGARVRRRQVTRVALTRWADHHRRSWEKARLSRGERWTRRPESNQIVLLLLGHVRHDLPKPVL